MTGWHACRQPDFLIAQKVSKDAPGRGKIPNLSPLPGPSPHSNGQKGSSPFWITPRYHRRRQDCSFRDPGLRFRIVFPSLYGTAPRFSFHRSNGNLNDTTILNSYFSILNCSVRHPSAASAARAICLPIPAGDALPRLEGRASRQSERIQFEECQSSPVSETDRAGSFCIPARLHFPRSCDIITQKTEREASPCAVSAPQRRS